MTGSALTGAVRLFFLASTSTVSAPHTQGLPQPRATTAQQEAGGSGRVSSSRCPSAGKPARYR
jgi:hypothetical protein